MANFQILSLYLLYAFISIINLDVIFMLCYYIKYIFHIHMYVYVHIQSIQKNISITYKQWFMYSAVSYDPKYKRLL